MAELDTSSFETDLSRFKYDDFEALPEECRGLTEDERTERIGAARAELGADVVPLDNTTPGETERAVDRLDGAALAEAGGRITVDDVPAYAATGVDVVPMWTLTHSAPSLDYSSRTAGE